MTGIDSSEVLLLLVIGLIVLGPKRLPEIATKLGGWVGQARRMTRVLKRQLEEELSDDGTPSIKPPTSFAASAGSGATEAASRIDDTEAPAEAEAHVPNDDDTYSPMHEGEGDEVEKEKSA